MSYITKVKIEKGGVASSYVKSEFDVSKIVESTVANVRKVYSNNYIRGGANPFVASEYLSPYGVMRIDYLPSLGGQRGKERFQLALKDQFVKVVGDAYSSLTLNECDLIKLAMYCEGLYLTIAEVDRALHTYDKFDKINKVFGRLLIESMGFQWNEIADNKAKWIDLRNTLAHIINTKYYLGKSARLTRHLELASKVYATDTNRKTQAIVFRPLEYNVVQDLTVFNIGLHSWNSGGVKAITLSAFSNLISYVRNAANSAWYDDVAPYLHHLYGDSETDLYKISDYTDMDDFAIVYAPDVLVLIKNMRLTQNIYKDTARSQIDDGIYITENSSGRICQGGYTPIVGYVNPLGAMLGCPDCTLSVGGLSDTIDIQHDKVVNVDEYPSSEGEIFSALLGKFTENMIVSGVTPVPGVLEWTSTTLFIRAELCYTRENAEGALSGYQPLYNIITDDDNNHVLTSGRSSDTSALTGFEWLNMRDQLHMFGIWPYTVSITYDAQNTSLIFHRFTCDIDNQFFVNLEEFEQFLNAEIYESATFVVPQFKGRK